MIDMLQKRFNTVTLMSLFGVFIVITYAIIIPNLAKDFDKKLLVQQNKFEARIKELQTVKSIGQHNNEMLQELHDKFIPECNNHAPIKRIIRSEAP
jgi:hypothetical protein